MSTASGEFNVSDLKDDPFEKYAIGQSVSRTEDPRLLRGDGCFTDDFNLPGQAHGYVFRSPYVHGRIARLDVEAATAAPGVLTVITVADILAAGFNTLQCGLPLKNRDGSDMIKPPRAALATGRVRYRGEAVAYVIA